METTAITNLSDKEKELLDLLGSMIEQHCRSRTFLPNGSSTSQENQFDSGFIRIHKSAMQTLVEYGLMECLHPEQEQSPYRDYDARFVDNWRSKLWRQS